MADTIERLYKLTVDGTQAARSLSEIERATANLDKRLASSADAIKKFGAVLAGAVSVGAIVGGIKQVIDSFDQLSKDAQKIGVAAEDLQRLRYAADLSGVGAQQLDTAITKLAQTMGQLDDKGNDAAAVLRKIGVEGGDNAVEALKKIADQFAKMPDGMQKTALAAQLFGKAIGPDMIPLLNAGGEALEELTREADKFGGVVSGSVLKSAEAFNDNLSRMQKTAAGVGAQLTAGMLPALQALSQSLTDAATTGDGFVSTGEAIGEMLLNVYGFALKAGATLQAFGMVIGAVMSVLSQPLTSGTSTFSALVDDINALEARTNTTLANLRSNFAKFKTEAAAGPVATTSTKATEDLIGASKRAADAAEAHRKAEEARWKELIRAAGVEEQANKALNERVLVLTAAEEQTLRQINVYKELNGQVESWLNNVEDEGTRLQILTDWLEEGTEAQKAYARSQLEVAGSVGTTTKTLEKQRDELDVLTEGAEGFFTNLGNGAADAEQLFKRMVQSIIAELLKLWAKKYIIDAFVNAFGGGTAPAATGMAFDAEGVIPFARGGVISRPVVFPMALAGEAGPEAILPLRRAADGNLGVQAQAAQMNVTVNNYADATVTTRQTGPNDLEVIVERTRAAIAADLRKGGNIVSRSLEESYGVGRGAAASF
jgi:hypothetical protein